MSRPHKQTVDYFPHVTKPGKTLFILERRFGNDGYSFWFKLLEILGATEGHLYNINDIHNREYLWARANVPEEKGIDILKSCAELEAIDPQLFEKGIIWSDNFIDNLEHLYKKRTLDAPEKPVINNSNEVSNTQNPHSIVKDSIVNNSIDSRIFEIIEDLNHVTGKKFRPTTAETVKHLNGRLSEGYTLNDFKRVHRVKFAEWGSNPEMEEFLRPSTLYRPSNFEGYVNKRSANDIQETERKEEKKKELLEKIDKARIDIEERKSYLVGMPEDHPRYTEHTKVIGKAEKYIIKLEAQLQDLEG